MKKFLAFLMLAAVALNLCGCAADKFIGTISGAENEYITIGDVKYEKDTGSNFTSKDRGKYLGQVSNSSITMRVYSVSGDLSGDYIYALWDWEGGFFLRQKQ